MDKTGKIVKVAGPLVIAEGMAHANMFDVVRVGPQRLIGEIIEMRGDRASIQVYEETAGIGAGEEVYSTGAPLSVELGPGLIGQIYDGIQRPLEDIRQQVGNTITRGIQVDPISRKTKWDFVPEAKKGQKVGPGDVLGSVKETIIVDHKILVPNGVSGAVKEIRGGKHTIMDVVAVIEGDDGKTHELTMMQKWPVRVERPYQEKLAPGLPMVTGQRIVDTFFPIAKGGTAAIPGPFGSGKTVTQHQLAKWSDVDIVIYIGCGERGNEMTDVLREFPELKDPRIADSTSRWAEALREMSGRLEEMPGEEGYPAYLGSRLAQFYERAGRVVCNGEDGRIGSLSAIGAVSPPGGDISEPVSQATLRIVKVFWGLDSALAYARHFPAINWLNSYSLYFDRLRPWYEDNVSPDFISNRNEAMKLLQQEAELKEIVQLVGIDALSPADRLVMETAQMIREDFLQQNAMSDTDSYCEIDKQFRLLELILLYYNTARQAIQDGAPMAPLFNIEARAKIGRAKDVHKDVYQEQYNQIEAEIRQQIAQVSAGGENA